MLAYSDMKYIDSSSSSGSFVTDSASSTTSLESGSRSGSLSSCLESSEDGRSSGTSGSSGSSRSSGSASDSCSSDGDVGRSKASGTTSMRSVTRDVNRSEPLSGSMLYSSSAYYSSERSLVQDGSMLQSAQSDKDARKMVKREDAPLTPQKMNSRRDAGVNRRNNNTQGIDGTARHNGDYGVTRKNNEFHPGVAQAKAAAVDDASSAKTHYSGKPTAPSRTPKDSPRPKVSPPKKIEGAPPAMRGTSEDAPKNTIPRTVSASSSRKDRGGESLAAHRTDYPSSSEKKYVGRSTVTSIIAKDPSISSALKGSFSRKPTATLGDNDDAIPRTSARIAAPKTSNEPSKPLPGAILEISGSKPPRYRAPRGVESSNRVRSEPLSPRGKASEALSPRGTASEAGGIDHNVSVLLLPRYASDDAGRARRHKMFWLEKKKSKESQKVEKEVDEAQDNKCGATARPCLTENDVRHAKEEKRLRKEKRKATNALRRAKKVAKEEKRLRKEERRRLREEKMLRKEARSLRRAKKAEKALKIERKTRGYVHARSMPTAHRGRKEVDRVADAADLTLRKENNKRRKMPRNDGHVEIKESAVVSGLKRTLMNKTPPLTPQDKLEESQPLATPIPTEWH
eukprot:GEMP01013111.1.p1 GENE.GEMP01013111.1~~GEMP01013111.1.p1  ORF type:complete len:625 (+),score=156.16 GEMP01013111.1:134-2008(+)